MKKFCVIFFVLALALSNTAIAQLSLDAAKGKCTELGFKAGTEQYGKCVLQLSKPEEVKPVAVPKQVQQPREADFGELTGTLRRIKESKVVKLGIREASVPLSYVTESGQPMGYSVDICLLVVDAIRFATKSSDLRIEFVRVTSSTRLQLVTGGVVDIYCGSMTNSIERQKVVSFSPNVFYTGTRIIFKKSSGIKSYDDLKGKTVVFTTGTISERAMKAHSDGKNLGINFIPSKDHAESFLMVETGRAVAFPLDDIILAVLRASTGRPSDYDIIGDYLHDDPYALMIRKDDPQFKSIVDNAVKNVFQSGQIYNIYKKWFQSPIPSRGINLSLPMSEKFMQNINFPTDQGVGSCGKINC